MPVDRTLPISTVLPIITLLACAGFSGAPAPSTPVRESTLPEPSGVPPSPKYEDFPILELPVLPGEKDEENRHPSTVLLKALGLERESECSGVVVGTDLILTAAHCVCSGRKVGSVTGGMMLMDDSACARSVIVRTLIQSWPQGPEGPQYEHMANYYGTVRPHPRFKMILERERVVTSHADLAIIVLEKSLEDLPPPIPLATTEVEMDEVVTVVGYNHQGAFGGALTARHFGKNVVGPPPSEGGEGVLLEPPEASTFRGDSGGPVLREGPQGLTLVGTVSRVSDQETVFTGTYSHQLWLRAEIQRTAARTAMLTPNTQP